MASSKKGKRQALKDIAKNCVVHLIYNEVGMVEVMDVGVSHLNSKETHRLNKALGL